MFRFNGGRSRMEFIRLKDTQSQYWEALWHIYITSFPIYEQRTFKDQIEALKDERYHCIAICENDKVAGILLYWEIETYRYVEHLAIVSDLRGKQYGTNILNQFCNENERVILEIDPPIDEVSRKRLSFYQSAGFYLQEYAHIHPPYRAGYSGHSLKVLTSMASFNEEAYELFYNFLEQVIMKYAEKQ